MRWVLAAFVLLLLSLPPFASAADWYARPYRPGGYGSSNGTSYANAFNGCENVRAVNWNAIQPGDTLYICGFHDGGGYDYTSYQPRPVMFPGKEGTLNNPITIRGDCPGDPGTIFGAGMQFNGNWTLHDAAYNIYKRNFTALPNNKVSFRQAFERHKTADKVKGIVRLNKPNNTDFASWQPGSYHLDNSTGTPVLYYKPASGDANDYTFYTGYDYPNIWLASYTVLRNINLMSSDGSSHGTNIGIRENKHHVTVDNVTTRWGMGSAIGIGQPNSYITIKNCKIREAQSGIYAYGTVDHLVVSNNEIYDLNQDGYYDAFEKRPGYRGDNHAIALQGGGDDMLIEHNYIHHIGGEGIIWYFDPGWASSMTNVTFRYNHVHDIIDLSSKTSRHNQRGIEFGGTLNISNPMVTTGIYNNKIYGNIIHDIGNPADDPIGSGIGIRIKAPVNSIYGASWSVYNNVVYNASYGFFWGFTYPPGFVFKNNIIMSSRNYHFYLSGAPSYADADINNNIYYPDGSNMFFNGQTGQRTNFYTWQGATGKDSDSAVADPLLVSPVSDFHLQSSSPAIDNGTDVGLVMDFDGIPIPQGTAPDIGAYEYSALHPCTESDWNYTDGICLPDNTTTRTWTKTGSCEGGVTHPSNETVSCVHNRIWGDLDQDGDVDIDDLLTVTRDFGRTSGYDIRADTITSGEIDIYDVVFVASRFT